MAKVLIPFSGGINSTYALHRWLTETAHDIVAVYALESWVGLNNGDSWRQSRETSAVNEMTAWLKTNCRDFTLEQKTDWPAVVEDRRPVRVGFTETHDYGIVSARYQGYSAIIDAHSPDIFVPGVSLENTATDCEPVLRHHYLRDGMQVVYAGSRTLDPVVEPLDYNAVAASLMGRFEQLEAIPADLKALMALKCDLDHGAGMDWSCLVCGYEKSREALASMSGSEFDAMFAEYGKYGAWRSEADPATYKYRGFPYRKFGEILGLPENVRWD
jgi:hypothetical protein